VSRPPCIRCGFCCEEVGRCLWSFVALGWPESTDPFEVLDEPKACPRLRREGDGRRCSCALAPIFGPQLGLGEGCQYPQNPRRRLWHQESVNQPRDREHPDQPGLPAARPSSSRPVPCRPSR